MTLHGHDAHPTSTIIQPCIALRNNRLLTPGAVARIATAFRTPLLSPKCYNVCSLCVCALHPHVTARFYPTSLSFCNKLHVRFSQPYLTLRLAVIEAFRLPRRAPHATANILPSPLDNAVVAGSHRLHHTASPTWGTAHPRTTARLPAPAVSGTGALRMDRVNQPQVPSRNQRSGWRRTHVMEVDVAAERICPS